MNSGAIVLAAAMTALTVACGPRLLTDSDLVEYAAARYDPGKMEGKHLALGVHRGVPVVVDFPCSDVCPAYTTRIIHYDLEPDATCTDRGGVVVRIGTPVGIGFLPVPYCVPRVVADQRPRSG